MKLQKWFALALALACIVGLLAGCGPDGGGTTPEPEIPEGKKVTDAGIYPIVRKSDNVTLKVAVSQRVNIEDYNTNDFTKQAEEDTNIKLEWLAWPANEARLNFMTATASGDLPDVFLGITVYATELEKFGVGEKMFQPLNALIDQYGTELKTLFKDIPLVEKQIRMSDGEIYALPSYQDQLHARYASKAFINKTWLDALGLNMPTTTQDFYDVLKAFATQDPNGNSKNDEIPLIGVGSGGWHTSMNFLLTPFLYTNYEFASYNFLNVDDNGKIYASVLKPEFKEALKYIRKLTQEKLIHSGTFSITLQEAQSLSGAGESIVGCYTGLPGRIVSENQGDYLPLPPLKGPNGFCSTATFRGNPDVGTYIITKECKYPEAAFRFGDYLMSKTGTLGIQYGARGVAWEEPSSDDKDAYGNPAIYRILTGFNLTAELSNIMWWVGPSITYNVYGRGVVEPESLEWLDAHPDGEYNYPSALQEADKNIGEAYLSRITSKFYEPIGEKFLKNQLPLLNLTVEEDKDVQSVWHVAHGYAQTTIMEFVTGTKNIDSNWEAYVAETNRLGMEKIIGNYQTAYDRMMK